MEINKQIIEEKIKECLDFLKAYGKKTGDFVCINQEQSYYIVSKKTDNGIISEAIDTHLWLLLSDEFKVANRMKILHRLVWFYVSFYSEKEQKEMQLSIEREIPEWGLEIDASFARMAYLSALKYAVDIIKEHAL